MSFMADYVLAETVTNIFLLFFFFSFLFLLNVSALRNYIEKQSDSIVHVVYKTGPTQA